MWAKNANLKGPAGDDAYTVAVKAGFAGTRADWLASLKGARGASWTIGSGAPAASLTGAVGDLYLDKDTGDLYQFS